MSQAYNDKFAGKYRQAKIFGNVAIYLTLVNIIYTLMADILIISLTLGLYCPSSECHTLHCGRLLVTHLQQTSFRIIAREGITQFRDF